MPLIHCVQREKSIAKGPYVNICGFVMITLPRNDLLRLGAQSVTRNTLRDPTQLRRRQLATRQGQVILFIHD